jgi:prepilin-type N-terminal cleavage/methylation domain-containing protein
MNGECRNKLHRQGFTLIEVSISATLFLLLALVFYGATINSLQYLTAAKKQTQAIYACQNKMEEVRRLSLDELDSLNGKGFDDGKGKIVVVGVYAQMRIVEVEYRYDDKREAVRMVRLVN